MSDETVKFLREERKRRALKQLAVAQDMGVTQQSISLIERGRRSPDVPTLRRYASALGYDLIVELVQPGEVPLSDALAGLEREQLTQVARFARLLPLLEGRDYRMRVKDLDILEEEYVGLSDDEDSAASL